LPILVLLSIIQSSVLFAIIIFIGLKLSKTLGLGVPILESYIANKKIKINPNGEYNSDCAKYMSFKIAVKLRCD